MRLSPVGRVVAGLSCLILMVLGPETTTAVGEVSGSDFDRGLAASALLLLVAMSAGSLIFIGVGLGASKTRWLAVVAGIITPRFLRRALFLGAAGALAISPVTAVHDTGRSTTNEGSASQSTVSRSLDGLQLPDRPLGRSAVTPTAVADSAAADDTVTVVAGDSLWSIASRHAGPGTSAAEINAAVVAWHSANRAAIGPDPNLIFPRQQLTPPTKDTR